MTDGDPRVGDVGRGSDCIGRIVGGGDGRVWRGGGGGGECNVLVDQSGKGGCEARMGSKEGSGGGGMINRGGAEVVAVSLGG